jgi:hypothetical protein
MGRSRVAVEARHVEAAGRIVGAVRLGLGACPLCERVELCGCTVREVAQFLARQRTLFDLETPLKRPAMPARTGGQGRLF